jgi:hypothetical protein
MELSEGIKAFDNFLSQKDIDEAVKKWNDKSSDYKGQIEIINAAKAKDKTAINWLFSTLKKVIAKAFWKYYVGPIKQYGMSKINERKDLEFAAEIYAMLLGDPEAGANPLDTFKPDKFSQKTNIIEKFAYYLLRYCESVAFQMLRADTRGGVTGQVRTSKGEEDISTVSYDEYFSNEDLHQAVESTTDDLDIRDAFNRFLEKLKKEDERKYAILSLKVIGDDTKAIAEKLGISSSYVSDYIKKMEKEFRSFAGM